MFTYFYKKSKVDALLVLCFITCRTDIISASLTKSFFLNWVVCIYISFSFLLTLKAKEDVMTKVSCTFNSKMALKFSGT